jgi:two-component system chemotaxis response regulator CheY
MYSIGEISKIVKISVDALRYYDEIDLLNPHHVDKDTRYRYYTEEQVKDLLFINELKQYNFSLDAIKELLQCKDTERLKSAFNTKVKQLSKEIIDIEKVINTLNKRIAELDGSKPIEGKHTVMIVDDAPFMRMMLKDILTKHGYYVIGEATNGQTSINMYFELKPDIVIMDITMPEKNGIEATEIIKIKEPAAKIVMLSAMGQLSMVLDSLSAGASDFIVKPFQAQYLLDIISKNLEENSLYNLHYINTLIKIRQFTQSINHENPELYKQQLAEIFNICEKDASINKEDLNNAFDIIKNEQFKQAFEYRNPVLSQSEINALLSELIERG